MECRFDKDCEKKCLKLANHKSKCSKGLCLYNKNNSKSKCQNGGQIISTFMYGRFYTSCICPETFIGRHCEIPNEMKASELRTFDLSY